METRRAFLAVVDQETAVVFLPSGFEMRVEGKVYARASRVR